MSPKTVCYELQSEVLFQNYQDTSSSSISSTDGATKIFFPIACLQRHWCLSHYLSLVGSKVIFPLQRN